MVSGGKDPSQYKDFDESNPAYIVRILSIRVDVLTRDKEDIENELREERSERKALDARVAKMEKSFQRGAGMMIMMPIIGTVIGVVFAYGKILFGGSK